MNKLTPQDITKLIDEFKDLSDQDEATGITTTDARLVVTEWLMQIGESKQARRFERVVMNYQLNPKLDLS